MPGLFIFLSFSHSLSIGGFIPVYSQAKNDLVTLYNQGYDPAVYALPNDPTRKVLWRYELADPGIRTGNIQAIDFSYLFYGMATLPENLGSGFFDRYNNIVVNMLKSTNLDDEISIENHEEVISNGNQAGDGLFEVMPNPAIDYLKIGYNLKKESHVSITIYDLYGRQVKTVTNVNQQAGLYILNVNVQDLKTGVYLCRLTNGGETKVMKLVIRK